MKVIIIGATGGIGFRVATRLTSTGHQVTGMVRRPEQASKLEREGIAAVVGDVATDTVANSQISSNPTTSFCSPQVLGEETVWRLLSPSMATARQRWPPRWRLLA
jgi:NAD(P)-dependent dehydrogenase (short-subunit alcohol dehydrogenase family)